MKKMSGKKYSPFFLWPCTHTSVHAQRGRKRKERKNEEKGKGIKTYTLIYILSISAHSQKKKLTKKEKKSKFYDGAIFCTSREINKKGVALESFTE